MPRILKIDKPADFCSFIGAPCPHPQIAVIDYGALPPVPHSLNSYGIYGLFIHSNIPDDLIYGCGSYDYRSGTLICVAPGQIGGKEDNGRKIALDGWALLFHPDLLKGSHLEKGIRNFSFFDYRVNEALHMSDQERDVITCLMQGIRTEIETGGDGQKHILVSYIDVLLNYCQRFYNRQFSTRNPENSDILTRFNELLSDYFDNELQLSKGLPGVQYFADRLNMSPNYFSDVIRRATGESAGNIIRNHIIRIAKNSLRASGNISQVAYSLGFDYPQHFSRMFKKQTGITPSQYIAEK